MYVDGNRFLLFTAIRYRTIKCVHSALLKSVSSLFPFEGARVGDQIMVNIYTALAFLALFLLIETKSLDASTERIAGGQRAILGQFLHQVSARRFGRHYCGGAIIGDRVVLTSASCLLRVVTGPPMNSSSTNVVAGTLTSSSPVQGTVYRVSRITNHPQFHLNSLANDISVIRTVDNIRFTNAVRAIGLPTANVADGAETTFSGWGQTRVKIYHFQIN